MKYYVGQTLLFVGIFVCLMLSIIHFGDQKPNVPTKPNLADRINAACKGSSVYDWTTGDEYNPVPAGTVKVTCVRKDQSLYYVAVTQ